MGTTGGPRQRRADPGTRCPSSAPARFFIVNGDTLTDVDVNALAAAHEGSGALVTLALVPNREPQKYGGVLTERRRPRDGLRAARRTR